MAGGVRGGFVEGEEPVECVDVRGGMAGGVRGGLVEGKSRWNV